MLACPMDSTLKNCPFNKYRSESSARIIDLAFEISDEEVSQLISHHKECLDEREYSMRNNQYLKAGIKRK
jgi:hypothetical protein